MIKRPIAVALLAFILGICAATSQCKGAAKIGDKELIRTVSPSGNTSELPIYVGLLDGKLKVIR